LEVNDIPTLSPILYIGSFCYGCSDDMKHPIDTSSYIAGHTNFSWGVRNKRRDFDEEDNGDEVPMGFTQVSVQHFGAFDSLLITCLLQLEAEKARL
jgi:hypothetical protein